ncbi:MAG: CdaR family protein [Chloroflexota bacterium]|nr:CdaR family protein [Chloroflexota bacterium]
MSWLIRNWPLKLGALLLATILYTGLVFSGSFSEQTFSGVPIVTLGQPEGSYLMTQQLNTVDIRYRIAADAPARVTVDSFAVTVDLSGYDMDLAPQRQSLPLRVRAVSEGLAIVSFEPSAVSVSIDVLAERQVRVTVDSGEVPPGLEIGTPRLGDRLVTASGPASLLARVDHAVARVRIDQSGIDVSSQVELDPVDVDGRTVASVELTPSTTHVDVDVSTVETSKTVPVRPILSGTPAPGYEIVSVSVDPAVITLLGSPEALAAITEVVTEPISLAGRTATLAVPGVLVVPPDMRLAIEAPGPTVTVDLRAAILARTFVLAVQCFGEPVGSACLPQVGQVAVTLRGTLAALDAVDPGTLIVTLDVTGLGPGTHAVVPALSTPGGLLLVGISPGSVTVVITPPATPPAA